MRQLDGAVYTNKDCMTSTTGRIEPLGYVDHGREIIDTLRTQLATKSLPAIRCIKSICMCGYCAPKAENPVDFEKLMNRHIIDTHLKIN